MDGTAQVDPSAQGEASADAAAGVEELLAVHVDRHEVVEDVPRAELLSRLVGHPLSLDEEEASGLLRELLAHRRALSGAVGREVGLHAALADLVQLLRSESPPATAAPAGTAPAGTAPAGTAPAGTAPAATAPAATAPAGTSLAALVSGPTTDALTGLPARDGFLLVVQHELNQRHTASLCILVLEVGLQEEAAADGAGTADGAEVAREAQARLEHGVAVVGRMVHRRVRRSDVAGRVGAARLALLLTACRPEKASMVVRQLEAAVRKAPDGSALRLSFAVAEAARNERAGKVLARAEERLEAALAAARAPSAGLPGAQGTAEGTAGGATDAGVGAGVGAGVDAEAADAGRLALYLGSDPAGYLEAQRLLAARGTALLWARERAQAVALLQAVRPALVLADVMAPPAGGQALLEAVLPRDPAAPVHGVLLAPRRMSTSLQKGRGRTLPVVPTPLEESRLEAALGKLLGAPRPAVPPLESAAEARALAAALLAVVSGPPAPPPPAPTDRPELALVLRRLAARH
jgi:GGDEF domain-containing protein/CheY-like chemotaxis protein